MSGFKYATLFLEGVHDDAADINLGDGVVSFEMSLSDLVQSTEVAHWKEWLGSLAWDALKKKRRVISARIVTARPDVSELDNEAVLQRVLQAVRTFALVRDANVHGLRLGREASCCPSAALQRGFGSDAAVLESNGRDANSCEHEAMWGNRTT